MVPNLIAALEPSRHEFSENTCSILASSSSWSNLASKIGIFVTYLRCFVPPCCSMRCLAGTRSASENAYTDIAVFWAVQRLGYSVVYIGSAWPRFDAQSTVEMQLPPDCETAVPRTLNDV